MDHKEAINDAIKALENDDIAYIENINENYSLNESRLILNSKEFLVRMVSLKRINVLRLLNPVIRSFSIYYIIQFDWIEGFEYCLDQGILTNVETLVLDNASEDLVQMVNDRTEGHFGILSLYGTKYISVLRCEQIMYLACLYRDLSLFKHNYEKFGSIMYLDLRDLWGTGEGYAYIMDVLLSLGVEEDHHELVQSIADKCFLHKYYDRYVKSILLFKQSGKYIEEIASELKDVNSSLYVDYIKNVFRTVPKNSSDYCQLIEIAWSENIILYYDPVMLTRYLRKTDNPSIDIVKWMFTTQKRLNVNAFDRDGLPIHHIAMKYMDVEPFVKLFIEKGAHLDYYTSSGNLAYHLAFSKNDHLFNPRKSPLKCLCAQKIVSHNISTNHLSTSLHSFVQDHKLFFRT